MKEKRKSERRRTDMNATFPLHIVGSRVVFERRYIPDRRLDNLSVKEVDCMEYILEIIKRER